MTFPHFHKDLIILWAKGNLIQVKNDVGKWVDCENNVPEWNVNTEYRVKPIPKPDIVRYCIVARPHGYSDLTWSINKPKGCNVKMIFDGESEQLKSVEMITSSN